MLLQTKLIKYFFSFRFVPFFFFLWIGTDSSANFRVCCCNWFHFFDPLWYYPFPVVWYLLKVLGFCLLPKHIDLPPAAYQSPLKSNMEGINLQQHTKIPIQVISFFRGGHLYINKFADKNDMFCRYFKHVPFKIF